MTEHLLLTIVFVVLMILWAATSAYPDRIPPRAGGLIPWCCVAILGWLVFHG